MKTITAVLLACSGTFVAASPRDVLSFDFGWEHRTGLHQRAGPNDPPPVDTDPGLNPAEAQLNYTTDADWERIQLPHDGLVAAAPSEIACPDGCSGKSYIPRHVLWYRKAFSIPAEWKGDAIWLDFAGSFRNTTVWINGARVANHICGYTPFRVRLDNITVAPLQYGAKNLVAIYVDPDNGDEGGVDHGSGWWYEGGGLYRRASLVRTSQLHVEQDGLFVRSNVSTDFSSATLHTDATLLNGGAQAATACLRFTVTAPNGTVVARAMSNAITVSPGASVKVGAEATVSSPRLWSSASPSLYAVSATVMRDHCNAEGILDEVETMHGFRTLRYDANDGFFLNEEHFKVRGFCDHNTFAVVGMAVPERVSLFRAQASRAIGGNGRRTSHNPPDPAVLDIYDRVGVVVMDENRLFANKTEYVQNMGAMVKRDRNHPSVVIWSFCNEAGCEGTHENGGPRFQAIAEEYDGTRPTLANMFTFGDLLSNTIDVQGFSHKPREQLVECHAKLPNKPIYMSECCSCNTMRDEDIGCETTRDNPHNACTQMSFNARCAESNSATNASDGVDYAIGTMVWTLFDYYGEPPAGGPEVSGTYGQYDLCGFPKAAAFWYRTQWLLTIPDGPDKTFPTNGKHEVFIVESWESPDSWPSTAGNKTRALHAYSSAPLVELFVNGASQGIRNVTRMAAGPGSYAEWIAVPWTAGNVTAIARDASGKAVAQHSRFTNGKATKLRLSIDAPSAATGTGSALYLDGHDAALLRGAIVDDTGRVMHQASNNITFEVISGPGVVQGTHNGDPHSHLSNSAKTHPAYHGLVRAVIRVTSIAARPASERKLMQSIDMDAPTLMSTDDSDIVVEASTPGFDPVRITIKTSTDANDQVYAVAQAAAGEEVDFFKSS